jgi:hypothetical protein
MRVLQALKQCQPGLESRGSDLPLSLRVLGPPQEWTRLTLEVASVGASSFRSFSAAGVRRSKAHTNERALPALLIVQ